jgi:hypothetical protein
MDQIIQYKQKFLDSWRYKRAYPFAKRFRSVLAFTAYLLGEKKIIYIFKWFLYAHDKNNFLKNIF